MTASSSTATSVVGESSSWKLSDPAVAGALKLGHLNAQTQEFTIR